MRLILFCFLFAMPFCKKKVTKEEKIQFQERQKNTTPSQKIVDYYQFQVKKLKNPFTIKHQGLSKTILIMEQALKNFHHLKTWFHFDLTEQPSQAFPHYHDYLQCAQNFFNHLTFETSQHQYKLLPKASFDDCLKTKAHPPSQNQSGTIQYDFFLKCPQYLPLNGKKLIPDTHLLSLCGRQAYHLFFSNSLVLKKRDKEGQVKVFLQGKSISSPEGTVCHLKPQSNNWLIDNCHIVSLSESGPFLEKLDTLDFQSLTFQSALIDPNQNLQEGTITWTQGPQKVSWEKTSAKSELTIGDVEPIRFPYPSPLPESFQTDQLIAQIPPESPSLNCQQSPAQLLSSGAKVFQHPNQPFQWFLGRTQKSLGVQSLFLEGFQNNQSLWCWQEWFKKIDQTSLAQIFWDQNRFLWIFFSFQETHPPFSEKVLNQINPPSPKPSTFFLTGFLLDSFTGELKQIQVLSNFFKYKELLYKLKSISFRNSEVHFNFQFQPCPKCTPQNEEQIWTLDLQTLKEIR